MNDIAALRIATMLQTVGMFAQSSDETVSMTAQIDSLPQIWSKILSPVTIAAQANALTDMGDLILQTDFGELDLNLLADALKNGQQQTGKASLEQIGNILSHAKQVTVTLQPGSPPTQALVVFGAKPLAETQPRAKDFTERAKNAVYAKGDLLTAVPFFTAAKPAGAETELAEVILSRTLREALKDFFLHSPDQRQTGLASQHTGEVPDMKAFFKEKADLSTHPVAMARAENLAPPSPPLTARILARLGGADAAPEIKENTIIATVISKTPDNQATLKAGNTLYFLRDARDLHFGDRLLLQPTADVVHAHVTVPDDAQKRLHALDALSEIIAQIDPPLAQALFRPATNNATTPALLLFVLNALKQGASDTLLGAHASDTLGKAGKKNMLGALASDLETLRQPMQDAQVGNWQSWPLPVLLGDHFKPVQLYVHQKAMNGDDQAQKADRATKTRFLITLSLSKLGPMQIDGLSGQKKLDLIIRTEAPLPASLQQELKALALATFDSTGLTGSLIFHPDRRNWVNLTAQKTESRSTQTVA